MVSCILFRICDQTTEQKRFTSGADSSWRLLWPCAAYAFISSLDCAFSSEGRFDKENLLQPAQNEPPLFVWWVTVVAGKASVTWLLSGCADSLGRLDFCHYNFNITVFFFDVDFFVCLLWSKCKLTPKPWVLRLKAPLLFEMLYFTHWSILQILSREIVWCLWM